MRRNGLLLFVKKPGEHPQRTKDKAAIECCSEDCVPLSPLHGKSRAPAREEQSHEVGGNSVVACSVSRKGSLMAFAGKR